jgi:glycosyltransferase involved in cell wall biosynthesis
MTDRKTIVIENLSALQGGGQTYLVNLLRHIPDGFLDEYRVVAIVPATLSERLAAEPAVEFLTPSAPQKGLLRRIAWFRRSLPRLLRDLDTDVLYCPGGSLSARCQGRFKTVVAFRNMLPFASSEHWRYPIGYQRLRNWLLRHIQSRSFRDADCVIFVSEFARKVIDLAVPDRRGESVVVPHGINQQFRDRASRPSDVVGDRDYCLYVSTFDVYKAQIEVVTAWAEVRQMRETNEQLLLVGPGHSRYRQDVESLIRKLNLTGEVQVLDALPYSDLPGLYQHATLNIFASSCENCPNILLEALAAGRAVLCSSHPPMPEFGGDAVSYFDPYVPSDLASRIVEVIDDEQKLEEMGAAALEQSARYDWARSAERTWKRLAALAG